MNNSENVVCFIITLAHGHPQLDGGGGGGWEVGSRPFPSWEHKITIFFYFHSYNNITNTH